MDQEIFELNNNCKNTSFSMYCSFCNSCEYCSSCNNCNFCMACDSCDFCNYSKGLKFSERMIFCLGNDKDGRKSEGYQKSYRVFNKEVPINEYVKILESLSDNEIVIDTKNISYEDAWAVFWNMATEEQKEVILRIPQFNKNIFEGITGINIEIKIQHKKIGV